MLLMRTCALCGAVSAPVCPACRTALRAAPALAAPMHVDRCSALLDYRSARELVPALKNRNRRDLVAWLATGMAALIEPPAGTVVTWAPTTAGRRQARGFDHAELLARAVARRLRLRWLPLLRRVDGPAQVGRSAPERWAHAGFTCRRAVSSPVLVVDDVVTTGATLTAAARALRAGGAREVHAVVVARAPAPTAARSGRAAVGFDLR